MANFWSYYELSNEQYLFERNLFGILFFLRLAIKALLNLPHLIGAYLITSLILDKQNSGLTWIACILLLGYLHHLFFHLFKSIIGMLKRRKNWLWIPFLIIALVYSCIFPTWMVWEATAPYLQSIFERDVEGLFAVTMLIFFAYFHTHFLHRSTDI